MDSNHVLVVGAHGRHFEIHKTTQAALPELFPLVGDTKSAPAAPESKKKES